MDLMRRDWDFVEIGDYRHDMEELGRQSAGVIATIRKERDDLQRLVFALVKAAGGSLSVPEHELAPWHKPDGELITERCDYDKTFRFHYKPPA